MARPIHACRQIGFGEWLDDLTGHQGREGSWQYTQQVWYTQLASFETAVKKAVISLPVVHGGWRSSWGIHSLPPRIVSYSS